MKIDYYGAAREEMLCFVPDSFETVLEIGCGQGRFSRLLMEQKPSAEIWGVEMSPEAVAIAQRALSHVIEGDIMQVMPEIPESYFDIIVCNDVLEHMVDPWTVLSALVPKFRTEQSVLVASLPNVRHWSRVKSLWLDGDWAYTDHGLMDRTHLRFFTPSSMRCLFVESGYQVCSMNGLHAESLPWKFLLLSKLLGKRVDEMKCLQYAIVAKVSKTKDGGKDKLLPA